MKLLSSLPPVLHFILSICTLFYAVVRSTFRPIALVLLLLLHITITYDTIKVTLHSKLLQGALYRVRVRRRTYIVCKLGSQALSNQFKPNDPRKSNVFNSRRNVVSDVTELSVGGSLFHARGAETKNERSPMVE